MFAGMAVAPVTAAAVYEQTLVGSFIAMGAVCTCIAACVAVVSVVFASKLEAARTPAARPRYAAAPIAAA
jgi:hypothetical protein